MLIADRLTLDAPRRTADGFLAVRAKAARTGVYDYLAAEVGAPEDRFKPTDRVKIYRDEAEVFAADSVRSFIGRPVTNDHPREPVTAGNWRDHARGTVMGAMRDGEYLAFDLVLMDSATISAVEAGKRELSNGYQCQLDWTPGTAPDGTRYDARQTGIRGNHVAVVDQGRAGPECAIKDGERFALCDANPAALAAIKETTVKKIVLDGLQVDLADADAVAAAISKLQDKAATATTALADANAKLATETGKVTALEAKLADAEARCAPAAIDKLVADRSALVTLAKAALPTLDAAGKTDAEIRRAVVAAKLGDKCPVNDAEVAGAFVVLTADVKPAAAAPVQNIGAPAFTADTAATRDAIRAARYA
ncbi:MAG: hypothetical protein RLZZ475_2541 [Pseudomonadota bacterium]|jgi:hypothetical protein